MAPHPPDHQGPRVRHRLLRVRAADHPRLPQRDRGADGGRPRLPRRRPRPPGQRLDRLLPPHPVGPRRGRPHDLPVPHVPDPDEHQGALQHRPRRQRGRVRARLPADDVVRRRRARRGLRAGHGRARLGGRAQPPVLDRPVDLDPAARRQPPVRDGRPARPGDHADRRPPRRRAPARPGPGRAVPRLARPQAALRPRGPDERAAPDRRPPRGADRRPLAAQARDPVGEPELAARRGVAVGVPARLRRHARHRRAARGVRPGQHLRRHPDHPGRAGHRRGHLHPHAGRLRPEPPPGHARRGLVPPRPVLAADPARGDHVPVAAGRAVVDRAARPPRPVCATSPAGRRPRASGGSSSRCASGSATGPDPCPRSTRPGLIPSGQRIDPGALEALDPDGVEDEASAADGEAGYPGPSQRRGPGDGPTGNVPRR